MTTHTVRNKADSQWGSIVLLSFGPVGHGVRSIRAFLKAKGFDTSIIFFSPQEGNELTQREGAVILRLLNELNSKLIGVSVVSPFFSIASHLTRRIREKLNVPIVWGGVHPTLCPEESIDIADVICRGEGEEAIAELAEAMKKSNDFTSIHNLWVRSGSRIWKNPFRPLLTDLDTLPLPDFKDGDKYVVHNGMLFCGDPIRQSNYYVVRANRGCPLSCGYCSNQALRELSPDKRSYFRRRSPENIIQEMKSALQEMNAPKLVKIDEVHTFEQDSWLEDLARRYQKEVGLPFEIEWYPGPFEPKIISMLAKAGLRRVVIGIESGSEEVRSNFFLRKGTNEHLLVGARCLRDHGVKLRYDLILDNPFENDGNRKEAFELILKLPKPYRLALYGLQFYPATRVTKIAIEKGLITPSDLGGGHQTRLLKGRSSTVDRFRFDKDKYYASLTILSSIPWLPRMFVKMLRKIISPTHAGPLMWIIRTLSFVSMRFKLNL